MSTGWKRIGNFWFYFDSKGYMAHNWNKIDGYWYYFGSNGFMSRNWNKINGHWYYFNSGGIMKQGFINIGNVTYFLRDSGIMMTGNGWINSVKYLFDSSGTLQGWYKKDVLQKGNDIISNFSVNKYKATFTDKPMIYDELPGFIHRGVPVENLAQFNGKMVVIEKEALTNEGRFGMFTLNGKKYWVTKNSLNRNDSEEDFINKLAPIVKSVLKNYDQFVSVMIAQAILESGWGGSQLASQNNNYFGIKAGKDYTGAKVSIQTKEWDSVNNCYYPISAYFKKYSSLEECFIDRAEFIKNGGNTGISSYYMPVFKSVPKLQEQICHF